MIESNIYLYEGIYCSKSLLATIGYAIVYTSHKQATNNQETSALAFGRKHCGLTKFVVALAAALAAAAGDESKCR